jgi:hypothetical protein
MELVSDRDRRTSIEDVNTSRLPARAARQMRRRKFDDLVMDDLVMVDVDDHHYENETFQQHADAAETEPDQARQSRGVA